jgi:thiol:disulfide interchange protein
MHFQKKLGLGFILFGAAVILIAYAVSTNQGAFVFSALIGLMAVFFGGFQLMLSKLAVQTKPAVKHSAGKNLKSKKARR